MSSSDELRRRIETFEMALRDAGPQNRALVEVVKEMPIGWKL